MSRRAQSDTERITDIFTSADEVDAKVLLYIAGDIVKKRFPIFPTPPKPRRGRPEGSRNRPKLNGAPDRTPGVAAILGEPA